MSFETTITHNIMKYLNDLTCCITEKVKGEAECSGRADINGCFRGHSMRIEVKTPDNRNKPTKKQLWNLWQWNNAGAICMVTYSLDTVKKVFDEMIDLRAGERKIGWKTFDEENKCKSVVLYPYSRIKFETLYGLYYTTEDKTENAVQNKTVGTSD